MKINTDKQYLLKDFAHLFNVSPILLKACNNHLTSSFIQKNTTVIVPRYEKVKHKIKRHDTLSSLSEQYKVSETIIKLCNNDLNSNQLIENVTINIPVPVNYPIVNDVNEYTFDKMINHIEQLTKVYPFIRKNVIGYSILNKPIIELTIGTGPYHTHFNSSFHGNEWITTSALMTCLNDYARLLTEHWQFDQSLMNAFEKTTVSIVPMVNPDGVDLVLNGIKSAENFQNDVYKMNNYHEDFSQWKANIVGVDLNKQFPALWDFEVKRKPKAPTFRDFPGDNPLSQPESIAMAALTKKNNFKRVHAFHTQGEEIYWGFQKLEPEISVKIAEHYSRVTNYKSVRYVNNYAGYKDWFIKKFRRPGFTIELGKGTNPLPFSQFQKLYDATLNIFLTNLALIV